MSAPGFPSPCLMRKACRQGPPPNWLTTFHSPCCWRSTDCRPRSVPPSCFQVFSIPRFTRRRPGSAAAGRPADNWQRGHAARCATIARSPPRRPTITLACCRPLVRTSPVATSQNMQSCCAEWWSLTDGGWRKAAALNPIVGADKVARFFVGVAAKNAGHDMRVEPAMINGAIGVLLYQDGELELTLSVAIDGEKIAAIYLVRNPDKLRHVPIPTPPRGARVPRPTTPKTPPRGTT